MTPQRAVLFFAPCLAACAAGVYFGRQPTDAAIPGFLLTANDPPGRPTGSGGRAADAVEPVADPAEPAPDDRFVGPQGDFRVAFPVRPQTLHLPATLVYRAADRFVAADGKRNFEVMRFDLGRTPSNPDTFLAGLLEGFAKRVRPDRPAAAVGGSWCPGREVVGRNTEGDRVLARVYVVGNRAFFAAVCSPTEDGLRDETATRFFDSLVID